MAKKKRVKRVFPKRFSSHVVNTGSTVNRERYREYTHKELNPDIPVPPTNPISLRMWANGFEDRTPPRIAVDRKITRLAQSDFRQYLETYNYISLLKSPDYELRLYFCSDKFLFIERQNDRGVIKRSIMYSGRARAMQVYGYNRITWVEAQTFSPSSPS